jgi:hypothetical protein
MVFRPPGGLGRQSRGQDSAYWMEAAVQPEFSQKDCATKLLAHEDALHREQSSDMLRRRPSLGVVSALQACMGSVSTLSRCTSAT